MRNVDERWMRRALRLAGRGFPAPNPRVGCVLVRSGRIVGEGWCAVDGGPHAERMALDVAGADAEGSTAYVTLEPCNGEGRTGSCATRLLEARVGRVVVGCLDPNPAMRGGLEHLREAGIEVRSGVLRERAERVAEVFRHAILTGRPFVTLKAAITLDGKIARADGTSKWITSREAREMGHRLRAEMGCVLIGARTAEVDDPALTARIAGVGRQPLRVVLDPKARLSGGLQVFDDSAPTAWLVSKGRRSDPKQTELTSFDPATVLRHLRSLGVTGVLIEGGAATSGRFLEAGLVDRVELFMANKAFGSGLGWTAADVEFEALERRSVGSDLWLRLRPVNRTDS